MAIANIFCDASMDIKRRIGCAGVCMVSEDFNDIIDTFYIKQYNATNNSAEILAIYHGVRMAIYYKLKGLYDRFYLFSDSKICIFGLKEWCYNWVLNQNEYGTLRRSDLTPIMNQNYFKDIIRMILDNDLNITFLHQKGHVNPKENEFGKASKVFFTSNGVYPSYFGASIGDISKYNTKVDTESRNLLNKSVSMPIELENPLISLISDSEMSKFNALTKLQ